MKLKIITKDPLNILSSTKPIIEHARHVFLHESPIANIAEQVKQRIAQGLGEATDHLGTIGNGNFEEDLQLIFIQDVVNFCFWEEKGQKKWQVEYPKGHIVTGGWYGLVASFKRARDERIPILDANYLSKITIPNVKQLFQSCNNTNIPMLQQRVSVLREAGKILSSKYYGKFINVLEESEYDAISLTKILFTKFPSFRDIETIDDKEVFFLKRAQICANDVGYVLMQHKRTQMKNFDQLTAFADYKVPQMLRHFGIISYSNELAQKVDNFILIPYKSREEIEIRTATIWGIELIRQYINIYSAPDIDNALWLISQTMQHKTRPYHRTRTIYY